MQLFDDIGEMISAPFVGELDLKHLFLLVGLVLLFIAAWVFIIHSIKASVEIAGEAL